MPVVSGVWLRNQYGLCLKCTHEFHYLRLITCDLDFKLITWTLTCTSDPILWVSCINQALVFETLCVSQPDCVQPLPTLAHSKAYEIPHT